MEKNTYPNYCNEDSTCDGCEYCNEDLSCQIDKEVNKYLLGCCTNDQCSEFNGGWKYPLDFTKEDQEDCSCPGCGDELEFIIQED